jgi:hypothetical protein
MRQMLQPNPSNDPTTMTTAHLLMQKQQDNNQGPRVQNQHIMSIKLGNWEHHSISLSSNASCLDLWKGQMQ